MYADKCCDTTDTTTAGCTSDALCIDGSATDLKPFTLCNPALDNAGTATCGTTDLAFEEADDGEDGAQSIAATLASGDFCGYHIYSVEDEEELG